MRLAPPNVISSAVVITIGLALVGHTTAFQLSCNNAGCPPGWMMDGRYKDCLQLRGCLFYAEIRDPSDPLDRLKTWNALRGSIGPNADAMFVYTDTTNGAAPSSGSKYWQATQFICWRAWASFSVPSLWKNQPIQKKDLSFKDDYGVLYQGRIDCTGADVTQKEVRCCKACPI
ncbi:hypothetical protein BCR37DRAFT_53656 [Protomyces lactucae-debilis]|uniref:Uncharacterized protein n=1 Tax=Protomyces lactucae-debilis TaxID=2754530 RepID=A0A1Y2FA53_PROLT|nr:uncharacterized protein BCR37DRAFT_53656 [Protomyces lactucae-debilis]ORY80802.1 hypothetical protein BCR37DRAFT_53656 [Protomyces lactucae-debilis]